MHYNPVAQTEHNVFPDEDPTLDIDDPEALARNGTANAGFIYDDQNPDECLENEETAGSRAGSILRSQPSSHSYEVVQENDFEEDPVQPLKIRKRKTQIESIVLPGSPTVTQSNFEETPVRMASISRHLPLNHPRPDLQSMQGAYVKNVERLEESAERLSMTSSLEEEVQKTKLDQWRLHQQSSASSKPSPQRGTIPSRQVSSASLANSITSVNATARWGGYSPSGYVTSFQEAARSGSWSRPASKGSRIETRISEQGSETRSFEPSPVSGLVGAPIPSAHPRASPIAISASGDAESQVRRLPSSASADRPPTSASNDTYRYATNLFRDFDGVHCTSSSLQNSVKRQIPLSHPPLATDSKAYREAQPGQNMVYYPAPVPMMLNLPPKLSKFSVAERDKRRTQALSGMPAELRKSAAWLQGDLDGTENPRQSRQSLAALPPQLRASAFFDQPSVSQNLQLQGGSAVATLDSILDASAHAPVTAFTDHPIVGHLGGEVYGQEANRKSVQLQGSRPKKAARRMSSLSNMLGAGRRVGGALSMDDSGRHVSKESRASELEADTHGSEHSDDMDRAAEQSIAPSEEELTDGEQPDAEDDSEAAVTGAPTTLLAELQMRKAQQKQRNRTAADAFPNGMHSTLLELDAVTQLQQKSRKQKHLTLAWEEHDAADQENFDDDDVPLGVLFPGQKEQANSNRPVGLLERRHIEDNEPLSQRRARLIGDAPSLATRSLASIHRGRTGSVYALEVPDSSGDTTAEPEEETLAQRLKRLRAEREKEQAGQFADRVSSQPGLRLGDENAPPASKTPDAEETLGQRRKRLQAEAAKGRQISGGSVDPTNAPPLKPKHSMASILSAYAVNGSRVPSNSPIGENGQVVLGVHQQAVNSVPQSNPTRGASIVAVAAVPAFTGFQPQMPMMNAGFIYNTPPMYGPNMAVQMQIPGYGYPLAMQQQVPGLTLGIVPQLDPKQRDGIERWRQSVA